MIETNVFGVLPGGARVERITLRPAGGASFVTVLTWGATLHRIAVPDRNGAVGDVALGYTSLDTYREASGRVGATIGRYANRIARSRFTLDGMTFCLEPNEGETCIHGGPNGFDRRLWRIVETVSDDHSCSVALALTSHDGDQGFPGEVKATARYTFDTTFDLTISYTATTTRPTVISMTNHAYFNLAGEASGSILGHVAEIASSRYLPVDPDLIPTGLVADASQTALDFTRPKAIGLDIRAGDEQIRFGRGFDHCYCLDRCDGQLSHVATVYEPTTGRRLDVRTTALGLQFNSGNALSGRYAGLSGHTYRQSDGFCLEPQNYPDAPNRPDFASSVLRPGQIYRNVTSYKFTSLSTP